MVLRDGGEALIEHELERVVVRAHDERPPPHVRAPVANSLHQADQLPLIGRHFKVTRGEGSAEEGDRSGALMKNCAET